MVRFRHMRRRLLLQFGQSGCVGRISTKRQVPEQLGSVRRTALGFIWVRGRHSWLVLLHLLVRPLRQSLSCAPLQSNRAVDCRKEDPCGYPRGILPRLHENDAGRRQTRSPSPSRGASADPLLGGTGPRHPDPAKSCCPKDVVRL